MELKEFIKDTVTQIADAVTELNGGTSKYPLTINPIGDIGKQDSNYIEIASKHCYITNIEFNLSLTTSDNKGNNTKVGVFASIIGVGVSSNEDAQNESVSRIELSLIHISEPTRH